jgi:hypothetical protein
MESHSNGNGPKASIANDANIRVDSLSDCFSYIFLDRCHDKP